MRPGLEINKETNKNKNNMLMKTKYFIFAASALVALASCSSNDFVGDESLLENSGSGAIAFSSSTPAITRASGADAAAKLDYKFKVYGVKSVSSTYSNVFATNAYSADATYNAAPYWVWYTTSTAGTTTSNTANWEYVGAAGSHGTADHQATLTADQTIKYWDYSADQYEFVAYSATHTSGSGDGQTPKITKYTKNGFTVEATAADLAGLYVADKKIITSVDYKKNVQFTFRAAGTKVRLGIYETIPGYVVKNVKFRPNASEFDATTDNAKLSGSFNGTSSGASGTYNVTYNATTGIAEFDNTAASANNYFDFGTFASATTDVGTTSTAPMWASGSANYQSVLPNTDNIGYMILYVDYDLYNSISGETIHVKGAKAVVPQMYMTWNPNYAYTYLFKISDNTNGTTGVPGTSPEGLFPITFDALTIATTDGAQVGTITTVSTPAITTYQNGSVSDAGITYANANGAIYITVNTDGTLASLTAANTKLYTVEDGTTEADLILNTKTKTEVAGGAADALSILDAAETSQGISFAAGTTAKFTPAAPVSPATTKTYAIEFFTAAVAATYIAATGTYVSGTTYYTDNTGTTVVDTSTFEEGTTDVSSYFVLNTPAAPAFYQYKIIKVVAGS